MTCSTWNIANREPAMALPRYSKPPHVIEILLFPWVGVLAAETFHKPSNELYLFFLPFPIVAIRLFIASLQTPPAPVGQPSETFDRAVRNMRATDQLAAFVLLLFECAAVVIVNPTVPNTGWFFVAGFFILYVSLRLWSRHFWIRAANEAAISRKAATD